MQGYVEISKKIAELFILIFVKISYALMWLLPWRAKFLEEQLKGAKNIYVGAGLIIFQGFNTLLDVPILLLSVLVVGVITPYRIPDLRREIKTKCGSEYRMIMPSYAFNALYDIPFWIMAAFIILSVVHIFRLRTRLNEMCKKEFLKDILKR
jgi:hypothetical protein